MGSQKIIGICAAIVAASFFIPWATIPFGGSISPFAVLKQAGGDLGKAPFGIWLFLASFVLAGVVAALAFTKGCGRNLAIASGLLPLGLIAYTLVRTIISAGEAGLPLPNVRDASDVFEVLTEILGFGFYGYVVGAIALTIAALKYKPEQPAST